MNKKGDMPFWLAMTIFVLIGLVLVLLFISLLTGKMNDIVDYIANLF